MQVSIPELKAKMTDVLTKRGYTKDDIPFIINIYLGGELRGHTSHGHWETPGGSVEFGETLEQAVRREVLEEYGAEIEIIEQFPAADHLIPAEGQHWVATTFLARFKSGQEPKIMEPDKCDEIGWFSLDKLPTALIHHH